MTLFNTSLPLPGFLRETLVSEPLIWGKLPSRGDYIRHNVKHNQAEPLQEWIRAGLRTTSAKESAATNGPTVTMPIEMMSNTAAYTGLSLEKKRSQAGLWHKLSPVATSQTHSDLSFSSVTAATIAADASSQEMALPWCFVLPPGTLSFSKKLHVIGVWMDSSDRFGRRYPMVMLQTASARWIRQYFRNHAAHPCEWLYFAARCIAQAVYAEETEQDRPHTISSIHNVPADHAATLLAQLRQLWALYRPNWREALGRGTPVVDAQVAQAIVGAPHAEDVVKTFDGVRYLPWADWPQRLTGDGVAASTEAAFWQQDLRGRFVGAKQCL